MITLLQFQAYFILFPVSDKKRLWQDVIKVIGVLKETTGVALIHTTCRQMAVFVEIGVYNLDDTSVLNL